MNSKKLTFLIIITFFVGVVATLILTSNFDMSKKSVAASGNETVQSVALGSSEPVSKELVGLESLSKAFVQVAKEVSPSVVTINRAA